MLLIPTAVSRNLGRAVLLTQKNSPTILFAAGVVGVVATAVLASRATLKLDEILDEMETSINDAKSLEHKKYSDRDRQQDVAYIYARTITKITKLYAPTAIVGIATIGCLTGSHNILNKRNVALTAAYKAMENSYKELEKRMRDELGDEKFDEYREGITVKQEKDGKKKNARVFDPMGYSPYAVFFDEYSQDWANDASQNLLFLRCQQKFANDLLISRGHIFLNEVYDMIGVDRTKAGAVVGWVISSGEGDNFVDFGMYDGDSERARAFINGHEKSILLDFNVDGVIYDKI